MREGGGGKSKYLKKTNYALEILLPAQNQKKTRRYAPNCKFFQKNKNKKG